MIGPPTIRRIAKALLKSGRRKLTVGEVKAVIRKATREKDNNRLNLYLLSLVSYGLLVQEGWKFKVVCKKEDII